jgi:septal ring-binding cell division protein DamX
MAEQLRSGQVSFEDGNFKSAFHKLLPLASEGNVEAEYAVGYMYYYGYGVTQDTESGLFWIEKSAAKQYQPAIKALAIIKENKVSEEPTQQLTAEQSIKEESDEVLKALVASNKTDTSTQPIYAEALATLPKQSETDEKQAADFNAVHQKKYTLQLMGSSNLADIKRTQAHLHIENNSYCVQTMHNGHEWYVLAYGKYPAPYLAKLAIDNLPQNVRTMNPWVREWSDGKIIA